MMLIKRIRNIYGLAAVILLLAACTRKDIATYNDVDRIYITGDSAQSYRGDSVLYSFAIRPSGEVDKTMNVVAYTIGGMKNYDRTFQLQIAADKTTAASDEYVLPATTVTVPAGAYKVVVPVVIKRTARLRNAPVRLTLKTVPAKDFSNGPVYTSSFSIVWNDIYTQPVSWGVIQWLVGAYSVNKYKLIIDASGYYDYAGIASAYDLQVYIQGQATRALNAYNQANPDNPLKADDGITPIGICGSCK